MTHKTNVWQSKKTTNNHPHPLKKPKTKILLQKKSNLTGARSWRSHHNNEIIDCNTSAVLLLFVCFVLLSMQVLILCHGWIPHVPVFSIILKQKNKHTHCSRIHSFFFYLLSHISFSSQMLSPSQLYADLAKLLDYAITRCKRRKHPNATNGSSTQQENPSPGCGI